MGHFHLFVFAVNGLCVDICGRDRLHVYHFFAILGGLAGESHPSHQFIAHYSFGALIQTGVWLISPLKMELIALLFNLLLYEVEKVVNLFFGEGEEKLHGSKLLP